MRAAIELLALRERIDRIESALGGQPGFMPVPDQAVIAIVRYAAFQMGLRASDIRGQSRAAPHFRARCAVCWTARQIGKTSLSTMGAVLDGRDHTSALNAIRRGEQLREHDPAFRMLTNKMLDHFTKRNG
jgi:chromosomal replication initiation ATPase DnaA